MSMSKYGRVLGVVLAGGKGERLMPLTKYMAKPAVPFGGKYRIIDFALSNLVNSGIFSIYVLVQFKSQSLNEHIEQGWQFGSALRGRDYFVSLVPAQMWEGEHWFRGTADAVYQSLHLIKFYGADRICIFAADHIYKMDVSQMVDFHIRRQADITVAANVVPSCEAHQFGCIKTDPSGRIIQFLEKPQNPPEIPGKPGYSYVSMGNYIFERDILIDSLVSDAKCEDSSHDFGKDIIPWLVKNRARVYAYDFSTNMLPSLSPGAIKIRPWRADQPYWRDVGTIKSYWDAHMELLSNESRLTLFNPQWPIRTVSYADPPSYQAPVQDTNCHVDKALFAGGTQILGAKVTSSVVARSTAILRNSQVTGCIIGQDVVIGRNCRITNAIIDSFNVIPDGTVIGEDPHEDAKNYHVDPHSGIVVVDTPNFWYPKDGLWTE